jgi:hypothetical protein
MRRKNEEWQIESAHYLIFYDKNKLKAKEKI